MILNTGEWPIFKKLVFSFLFVYWFIYMAPWTWLNGVHDSIYKITQYWDKAQDGFVQFSNSHVFHHYKQLVPINGSGDTSWAFTYLWSTLIFSVVGAFLWVILWGKKTNFNKLDFWLVLFLRYYICMFAFIYGILKVFCMQMVFPSLSYLATPLGDLLPMRLSWFFIGYSSPYQFFSGVMEVLVGLLLLWRKTTTIGALMAVGVFLNVFMLNICYDIPVKLFSLHILIGAILLVVHEYDRLVGMFIKNQSPLPGTLYEYDYGSNQYLKIGRIVAKVLFIGLLVILPFYQTMSQYISDQKVIAKNNILPNGYYEVMKYSVNGIDKRNQYLDSIVWKNLIFDGDRGSALSKDTLFRQVYNRGYFRFEVDTMNTLLKMYKANGDSIHKVDFKFRMLDSSRIQLQGKLWNDSVSIDLQRVVRHFQLAEKQFHWLSEYNR